MKPFIQALESCIHTRVLAIILPIQMHPSLSHCSRKNAALLACICHKLSHETTFQLSSPWPSLGALLLTPLREPVPLSLPREVTITIPELSCQPKVGQSFTLTPLVFDQSLRGIDQRREKLFKMSVYEYNRNFYELYIITTWSPPYQLFPVDPSTESTSDS